MGENMSFFNTKIKVDIHDVDFNGIARASALMKYIQSAAQTQLTESGMSYEKLKGRGKAFILSRIKMEIIDAPRAYEPLVAETFPCESRGYSFLRCYQLKRDGEVIARAASIWALVDVKDRSLIRVNDFELGLETFDHLDITMDRTVMPADMREVGSYTVSYGDTDQNRHMNNTRYPDLFSSFLPMENKRIKSISINYRNEAPMGECLKVYLGEKDGFYYLRTVRADGKINTEAEICLEDIL